MTTTSIAAGGLPLTVTERQTRRPDAYGGECVELSATLPISGRSAKVDAWGPDLWLGGEVKPPQVNWSALGSVAVTDALAHAALIQFAAERCSSLRGPVIEEVSQ